MSVRAMDYHRWVIIPGQIRAGRALLQWTQKDLADRAGVSLMAVKNLEREAVDPRSSTLAKLQDAFEAAGVVFLDRGDVRPGGPGIRLK